MVRPARERDAAEVRVAETQVAQRRLVESSAAVRRQVVRDLHDGAQQWLVTLLRDLQLATDQLDDDPAEARWLLDDAIRNARAAIDELRELATGLHPRCSPPRPGRRGGGPRPPLPLSVAVAGAIPQRLRGGR